MEARVCVCLRPDNVDCSQDVLFFGFLIKLSANKQSRAISVHVFTVYCIYALIFYVLIDMRLTAMDGVWMCPEVTAQKRTSM